MWKSFHIQYLNIIVVIPNVCRWRSEIIGMSTVWATSEERLRNLFGLWLALRERT